MRISALISDVDGTLMTHDKVLTPRTCEAVAALQARGIGFAAISGRPPRGMRMLVEPLALTNPIGGFNGGQITNPDLSPLEEHALAPETAHRACDMLRGYGLDVWVFSGQDWLLTNPDDSHVAGEIRTVRYQPLVVRDFDGVLESAFKIVGVSDDHDYLARCEAEMQAALGEAASASRSQSYYLDITHPQANKAVGVQRLAALMGVPMGEVAVIGDGHNDLGMFAQSGLSIAMGNAPAEVKNKARFVTGSNDQDGLAEAIQKYILDA
ncbi:Cof-type HAD-IIB family hydrolase [Reyranella sp.]|uniref:Cof-type HAD-IIB family hydrolase n=1 Tax=Reyranella sp. TaxID=1929291 RepID=UPI003D1107BA